MVRANQTSPGRADMAKPAICTVTNSCWSPGGEREVRSNCDEVGEIRTYAGNHLVLGSLAVAPL